MVLHFITLLDEFFFTPFSTELQAELKRTAARPVQQRKEHLCAERTREMIVFRF